MNMKGVRRVKIILGESGVEVRTYGQTARGAKIFRERLLLEGFPKSGNAAHRKLESETSRVPA